MTPQTLHLPHLSAILQTFNRRHGFTTANNLKPPHEPQQSPLPPLNPSSSLTQQPSLANSHYTSLSITPSRYFSLPLPLHLQNKPFKINHRTTDLQVPSRRYSASTTPDGSRRKSPRFLFQQESKHDATTTTNPLLALRHRCGPRSSRMQQTRFSFTVL